MSDQPKSLVEEEKEIAALFEAASEEEGKEKQDTLRVAVQKALLLNDRIEKGELLLKELKKNLLSLTKGEQAVIPMLLSSLKIPLQVTEFNGKNIPIKLVEDLEVNVPKEDKEKRKIALQWMVDNNGADLISKELIISNPTKELKEYLIEQGYEFEEEQKVDNRSVKAWLKRLLGMGGKTVAKIKREDVPTELTPFFYKEAVIGKPL